MGKSVGIVTWYNSNNYGSQLQAYALFRILSILGFNSSVITMSHHPVIRRLIDCILYRMKLVRGYSLKRLSQKRAFFTKKYLKESYLSVSRPSFKKYNAFICGSDQIWAPNLYNPFYMLSFVPDEVNKISYAASIGLEDIPDNLIGDYKKYIGRINHISVREEKGRYLLQEKCGLESTVVLDPTLLLGKNEWDNIKKELQVKSNYIFCYFLNKNHKYKQLVKEFAEDNNYEIYGVSDNPADVSWMHLLSHQQVGPCEFIGMIEGAKAIITDSYHGTIFSMLYHKNFILFERFSKDDKICQNSRIEQLRHYFSIDDNIVKSDSINKLELCPVDYKSFEITLAKLRDNSIRFLKDALS